MANSNSAASSQRAVCKYTPSDSKAERAALTINRYSVPNTARLIALMLASQGIEDADERVLHQLMDFSHRELVRCEAGFVRSSSIAIARISQGIPPIC